MAEDWIKMRKNLANHPKTVRISSAMSTDRFRTLGGLFAIWSLFDTYTETGEMAGYTLPTLSESIGWPGFAEAMHNVEWLEVLPSGVVMPRFDTHNGESAKKRAMDAERKRVRRMSAVSEDKTRTESGPEKEKEKNKKTKSGPSVAELLVGVDSVVVADFTAIRYAKRAPITPTAVAGIKREAAKAGLSLEAALRMACERGWQSFKAEWLESKGGKSADDHFASAI